MNKSSNSVSLPRVITGFAVALVVALGSPGSTWASDLEIERASISRDGNTLRVRGKNETNDNTVTVLYPGDGTFIGTARTDRDGDWNLSVPTPDPAPCRVRAEAGNDSDQRNVRRAPSDCNNNGGGGGGNNPPDANNDSYSTAQDTALNVSAPGVLGNDTDSDGDTVTAVPASGATGAGGSYSLSTNGAFTYTPAPGYTGNDSFSYTATDGTDTSAPATVNISVTPTGGGGDVTARGDVYATPVGTRLEISASRLSGVLYNDFGGNGPLSAELVSGVSNGNLSLNSDGSFTYTPNNSLSDNDNDSFTYQARDSQGNLSGVATVNIGILSSQEDFKIFMNYELGMHCTGFEFAYCCVLPPYNSILAQVVKPNTRDPDSNAHFPRLLEGDPRTGLDGLGRETVLRDYDHDGNFMKYYLEYYHDAQPRREGQGKPQTSTLISDVEGNSLLYPTPCMTPPPWTATAHWSPAPTTAPPAWCSAIDCPDGSTVGCTVNDATDNYANGWLNHFYIYADLEGTIPPGVTSLESEKLRLGVSGHVEYPANSGAALQPLGPTGNGAFDNVLTFSTDTGTVVYTQMKVLENLPVMLTSPRMWEALGLPLTPFEDSVDFFGDPGAVDEDSIRPYVAMKASMHEYPSGNAVIGSNGKPVIGFGTAPIDIPNCERCHSAPATRCENPAETPPNCTVEITNVNSPSFQDPTLVGPTNQEIDFWNAYYNIVPGVDSDWYSRLKGAAINMMTAHDTQHGTSFTANYPGVDTPPALAQNTRLGHESVICQKCHADNVIAVVKSAFTGTGDVIPPISEAIHYNHRNTTENNGPIVFNDTFGRDGGCQGCHPAHRSDGVMDGYPITLDGDNFQANSDNRLAIGGCFVGRDVHSNPMKDIDGAETPEHLNAVGSWLKTNVAMDSGENRGIWCTNCHSQLGQEIWRTEDCNDLINGDCLVNPRGESSLGAVAAAVGVSLAQAESWLDPKVSGSADGVDRTHAAWDPNISDAGVATIEVDGGGNPVVTTDGDGDISVNILSFCTTTDCVNRINANKGDQSQWRYPANPFIDPVNNSGAAVPMSAATDGRDHWLAPGEPHCADCHAAPYTEQSGNINPFPPFNYPAKASLMRYSRGHQDITCQGCHESIHGLYPVTPTIDTTSYAQAAALNHDGSHGPLKCGTCHEVNGDGIPTWLEDLEYNGQKLKDGSFDNAVTWAHTFTEEADVLDSVCLNCHGDERNEVSASQEEWLEHATKGRVSRAIMDRAEIDLLGQVAGTNNPLNTVCRECHDDKRDEVSCSGEDGRKWRQHLSRGRVAESVWETVSLSETGSTCGW